MTAAPISTDSSERQIWVPVVSIAIIIASLIALANLAIFLLGGEAVKAGFSVDPTPVEVEIAGEKLLVPMNMIRFSDQRSTGKKNRLDMIIHWPSLQGYAQSNAQAFDDVSPTAPLIFLSLAEKGNAVDSTTRLISLYSRFFDGTGSIGPAGLVSRNLQPGSGYDNEEIFFEPGSTSPFSARCMKDKDGVVPVTCLRDIHVADRLAVSYRFRKPLIVEWKRFDAAINMLIDKMRVVK